MFAMLLLLLLSESLLSSVILFVTTARRGEGLTKDQVKVKTTRESGPHQNNIYILQKTT